MHMLMTFYMNVGHQIRNRQISLNSLNTTTTQGLKKTIQEVRSAHVHEQSSLECKQIGLGLDTVRLDVSRVS